MINKIKNIEYYDKLITILFGRLDSHYRGENFSFAEFRLFAKDIMGYETLDIPNTDILEDLYKLRTIGAVRLISVYSVYGAYEINKSAVQFYKKMLNK